MEISAMNNTPLLAMSTATTAVGKDLGLAMLSKQLDTTEAMGSQMIAAMEMSVNPSVGSNFDMSV